MDTHHQEIHMTDTIAEIVTFRLKAGATEAAFLTAMETMQPFVDRSGGVIARTISCDPDGLWTDHVLWNSEDEAKALAAEFMTAPETEDARALIDETTITMRHAKVLMHRG
jgi:hypothetical protein